MNLLRCRGRRLAEAATIVDVDEDQAVADDDTRAVRLLTTAVNQLISGWAESDRARRQELWLTMADRNDELFDRFADRFSDLDRRFGDVDRASDPLGGTYVYRVSAVDTKTGEQAAVTLGEVDEDQALRVAWYGTYLGLTPAEVEGIPRRLDTLIRKKFR